MNDVSQKIDIELDNLMMDITKEFALIPGDYMYDYLKVRIKSSSLTIASSIIQDFNEKLKSAL